MGVREIEREDFLLSTHALPQILNPKLQIYSTNHLNTSYPTYIIVGPTNLGQDKGSKNMMGYTSV